MKRTQLLVAFSLALGAHSVSADAPEVVTGGHVLSAMMTSETASCSIAVTGSLDPVFKGADSVVDLVCLDLVGAGTHVVGTTRSCPDTNVCASTIDPCTGKFAFTIFGSLDPNGVCTMPHAGSSEVCFFTAHVASTNRQACGSSTPASGPDPNGTAPCSSVYCNAF